MSIQQGTIAAKIVGINQTKNGLSSVLEQWGEEVPQTFAAYPNAFNSVFENLDEKIDAVSSDLSVLSDTVEDLSDSLSDYARTAALSDYVLKATSDTQFISTPLCDLKPLSAFELNAAYGTNSDGMLVSYGTVTLNNYNGDKTILFPARTVVERVGRRIINVAHKPEIQSHSESLSTNYTLAIPYENGTIATKQNLSSELSSKADISSLNNYVLSSSLATVATTGSYNDLTNKPTIPTVNNGTLTIQKNGSNVQTFTANQSSSVTANISVPTKTSDLTNDSGFLTAHQDLTDYAKKNDLSAYLSSETDPEFNGWLSSDFIAAGISAMTSADVADTLPYDAELEYIEKTSTSESYFDTGFIPLWNDTIQSKWSINENKNVFFYMARSGFNQPSRGLLKLNTANTFRADRVLGSSSIATNFSANVPAYTLGTWFEVFDAGTGAMQLVGLDCGYNGTPNTGTAGTIEGTMLLFSGVGGNSWSSSTRFAYLRIFSGAANDDTAVLKLDLIPVRVGNTPYIYDRVSKTLIAKSGADDLVCGPDKRRTAVAVGSQAYAEERSVAIGSTANAVDSVVNKFGSVAIGDGAKAIEGVAIGPDTEADCSNFNIQSNAVAIGKSAYAKGASIAIGTNAQSGKRTNTNAYMGISIGRNAGPRDANRDQVIDITINNAHPSMGNNSTAIGAGHGSVGDRGIAIGYGASAGGIRATAVGESSNASGDTAICYGRDARASGTHAMALGYSSRANAAKAIAIGKFAQSLANDTITIGSSDSANANALSGSVQFWDWTAFKRNEDNTNLLLDADRLPDDVVFTDDLDSYATKSAVNAAIGTINDNLSGIADFLASKYKETAQCDVGSRATGWTYSPDASNWTNKIRFFHWGQLGLFFGYAKCSSDIAANGTANNIGTVAFPSGYSIPVATFGTRSINYILTMGSGGAMGIRAFAKITANSTINLGFMCMLGNVGDRWSRTNVATI